jgi:hypothetical protein
MKPRTVTYQRAFVVGPYLQERIGFEAQVDDHEEPEAVLEELKEMAKKFHLTSNPQLYPTGKENLIQSFNEIPEIQKEPKEKAIDGWVNTIQSITTLRGLENLRPMVEKENNPRLLEAFENKLKSLQ